MVDDGGHNLGLITPGRATVRTIGNVLALGLQLAVEQRTAAQAVPEALGRHERERFTKLMEGLPPVGEVFVDVVRQIDKAQPLLSRLCLDGRLVLLDELLDVLFVVYLLLRLGRLFAPRDRSQRNRGIHSDLEGFLLLFLFLVLLLFARARSWPG